MLRNPPEDRKGFLCEALALLEDCRNYPSILLGQADHCWHDANGKPQHRGGWRTVVEAKERVDDRYPVDV